MARAYTPKVITANDLLDGDVIYLTANGGWTRVMSEAVLAESETQADALMAIAGKDANGLVGLYLADAQSGVNGPEPVHFREAFRTRGPSNYFHGKQAEV
ncbi:MAG TPA: DUF2849 domain-containing protein [Paracoccaceae bacterium]|nr:DUF2849 domain-containing protein [Paracoccaceae bacterium]